MTIEPEIVGIPYRQNVFSRNIKNLSDCLNFRGDK